jgi:hypothetical protein
LEQELSGGKSEKIEPREAVLVTFKGRIADDRTVRDGPLFQKAESWLIVVGDSDVIPALDMVRRACLWMVFAGYKIFDAVVKTVCRHRFSR